MLSDAAQTEQEVAIAFAALCRVLMVHNALAKIAYGFLYDFLAFNNCLWVDEVKFLVSKPQG